eukprot:2977031-Alexandrium_andersonii.AAC.1
MPRAASGLILSSWTASQSRCRFAAASQAALPWRRHGARLTVAPRSVGRPVPFGPAAEGQQGHFCS